MKPYVGLTGVRTPDEAGRVADIFENEGFHPSADRVGMIGVLTASGREHRGKTAQTRHAESARHIHEVFAAVRGRILPMLHVEISKEESGSAPFAASIAAMLNQSGVYEANLCRHLQLNGHPSPDEVRALLQEFPLLQLVFQIRKELVAQGGDAVVRALDAHDDRFSYALIDPSAGTGTEFDIGIAAAVYETLRRERPDVRLGFAGGFSPENAADRIGQLRRATATSDWCIDVEGRVRDSKTDVLDLQRFAAYVAAAKEGFYVA